MENSPVLTTKRFLLFGCFAFNLSSMGKQLFNLLPSMLSPYFYWRLFYRVNHFILYDLFDPVKSVDKLTTERLELSPLMMAQPFLAFTIGNIYGNLCLEETLSWAILDLATFNASPYPCFHQIFFRATWRNIDICISVIGYIMFGAIYLTMIFNRKISPRYWMFLYADRARLPEAFSRKQVLDRAESLTIADFQRKYKRMIIGNGFSFLIACLVYTYLFLGYYHRYEYFNLRQVIFWAVVYPVFCYYHVVATIMVLLYNGFLVKYIEIRQQVVLEKLQQLNAQLRTPNYAYLRAYWLQFSTLNHRVLYICKQIEEYSRFWMPYLTILMMGFFANISYLVYVCFLIRRVSWLQNFVLYPITLNMILSLFALTARSATMVRKNQAIVQLNRRFLYQSGPMLSHNVLYLLKAEAFQAPRRLEPYCFHLFGDHQINSQTFNMIITYTVGYFMLVFKNKIGNDG